MSQVDFTVSGIVPAIQQPAPNTGRGTAAAHARILKGISGDGESDSTMLSIVDPRSRTEYTENVTILTQKFDKVARKDLGDGADFRPHAIHSLTSPHHFYALLLR
jgi:hypothetical protein